MECDRTPLDELLTSVKTQEPFIEIKTGTVGLEDDVVHFKLLGATVIRGRGLLLLTELPDDCETDLDWLIGATVVVGKKTIVCRGVERYAHMLPYRKGERIGILADTWHYLETHVVQEIEDSVNGAVV